MRIAIPTSDGRLHQHFGHCAEFAILDVDPVKKEIAATTMVKAPEHQPGLLPPWRAGYLRSMASMSGISPEATAPTRSSAPVPVT